MCGYAAVCGCVVARLVVCVCVMTRINFKERRPAADDELRIRLGAVHYARGRSLIVIDFIAPIIRPGRQVVVVPEARTAPKKTVSIAFC